MQISFISIIAVDEQYFAIIREICDLLSAIQISLCVFSRRDGGCILLSAAFFTEWFDYCIIIKREDGENKTIFI